MNWRNYDLNLLTTLEAVLREGSISAGARRLNLTQPAVSQALGRARVMFGDPLMVRSGRGLRPTRRGAELRDELGDLLGRIAALIEGPAFDPAKARRSFTIATSDLGEAIVLPAALGRLTSMAPGCKFDIRPPRHDFGEDVPDLILMGAAPPKGSWRARDLFADRFVLMAAKGHPALKGPLTPQAFAALPQAFVSPRGDGAWGPVDAALAEIGLRRHVGLTLTRFSGLPAFLVESGLVAAVPSRYAALPAVTAVCAVRPLPVDVPPFTMRMVWHRSRDEDAAQQWLREGVLSASPQAEPGAA